MVTMFSFVLSLSFGGRCCGRLRCNCLRSHVHSSLLLSNSCSILGLLSSQCAQRGLALGLSLIQMFCLGNSLGFIIFSFSELLLRFSLLCGDFQIFPLLL